MPISKKHWDTHAVQRSKSSFVTSDKIFSLSEPPPPSFTKRADNPCCIIFTWLLWRSNNKHYTKTCYKHVVLHFITVMCRPAQVTNEVTYRSFLLIQTPWKNYSIPKCCSVCSQIKHFLKKFSDSNQFLTGINPKYWARQVAELLNQVTICSLSHRKPITFSNLPHFKKKLKIKTIIKSKQIL